MRITKGFLMVFGFCLLTGCTMETVSESMQQVSSEYRAGPRTQSAATVSVHFTAPSPTTNTTAVTSVSAEETHIKTNAVTTAASAAAQKNTEDWMFRLANKTHPVGDYAPPEFVTLKNDVKVDARMYPALQQMYDDMRRAGLSPITREGYRTYAQQEEIMETRIQTYLDEGRSKKEAKELAEAYVAVPGTSEHQLGLAVDVNSTDGRNQEIYNWLKKHAHEYGFIQRYPAGKEAITGIQEEAWHYRYVGLPAAEEIYTRGITLEEYLGAA